MQYRYSIPKALRHVQGHAALLVVQRPASPPTFVLHTEQGGEARAIFLEGVTTRPPDHKLAQCRTLNVELQGLAAARGRADLQGLLLRLQALASHGVFKRVVVPLKLASEALASLTGTAVSRLREVMGHVAVALLGTVVSAMEQVNGSDDVSEMLRALLFVDVLEQVCALCSALASVTGLRDFQFAPRVAETDGGAIVLRDPVSAFRAGTLDMETNPAGLRLDLADYRMTARRLLEQGVSGTAPLDPYGVALRDPKLCVHLTHELPLHPWSIMSCTPSSKRSCTPDRSWVRTLPRAGGNSLPTGHIL